MNKQFYRKNMKTLMMFFLIISIIMWAITIYTNSIHTFPPEAFYLVTKLSVEYWIGFFCSIFVLLLYLMKPKKEHLKITFFAILIISVYLFGIGSFIYDNTRYHDVYKVNNEMETLINQHGSFFQGDTSYESSFPGYLYLFSSISFLSGIKYIDWAKYFPVYMIIILILLTLTISLKLNHKYSIIPCISIICYSWIQAFHLSPQALGIIAYFTIWSIFFLKITKKNQLPITSILIILIFLSVVISHHLSGIVIAMNFIFISIFSFMILKKKHDIDINLNTTLSVLLIVLWLTWLIYIAQGHLSFVSQNIEHAINSFYSGDLALLPLQNPQWDFKVNNILRQILSFLELIFAIVGIICIKYIEKTKKYFYILLLWIISNFSLSLYSLGNLSALYARSILFNILPFSLATIGLFIASPKNRFQSFLKPVKILFICFLIISLIVFPITYYGGDSYEFISDSNLYAHNYAKSENLNVSNIEPDFAQRFKGPYIIYDNYVYNYKQTRYQNGTEYNMVFSKLGKDKLYDSGDSSIYSFSGGKL